MIPPPLALGLGVFFADILGGYMKTVRYLSPA